MSACGEPKELSWEPYNKWLLDHQDRILKEREINDIKMTLRYVPADVSAYKDLVSLGDDLTPERFDSLREFYRCGLHFQLSLEADVKKKNLLYYNTTDMTDYRLRIEALSFNTQEFISLEGDGKVDYPVLSQYEGYNELSNTIRVHLVFSPEWFQCEKYAEGIDKVAVVFKDPYWDTGVNRFAFETQQLKNLPNLKI